MAVVLASMWVLILVTFSVPGREGPTGVADVDWIALLKIGSRAVVFVALAGVVARRWHLPKRRDVVRTLLPFFVFLVWAAASVLWSPLKAMSLGQVFSLAVLVLLALAVAIEWRDESDTSAVLGHLAAAFLVVSTILLGVHITLGGVSGLDRSWDEGGALGLMHPTSAGATASLGIVVVIVAHAVSSWVWPRWLLWPALFVHTAVLMIALSRTALGLAVVVVGLAMVWLSGRRQMAATAAGLSIGAVIYPVFDPGFDVASRLLQSVAFYVSRGESSETLWTLTGRTELWQAVWASISESPLMGHGYYVASSDGFLDAWSGPAIRTAHNLLLHVLVSTGLIGVVFFAFGLIIPVLRGWRGLRVSQAGYRLGTVLVILCTWYFGWSLLSESFMGQLQPESVLFFAALGLAVGQSCEQP